MASLDIGRTFSRTGGLVGASLGSVGVFVLAVHLVTMVWQYFVGQKMAAVVAAAQPSPGNPMAGLSVFSSGWYWASLAVSLVIGAFSMAGAIGGMQRIVRGEAPSIGDCVGIGLGKLAPVMAFMVLWVLAIMLGTMLLVVPGLILLTMWAVALPVLVAGEAGVFGAFGRSRGLTSGSRWRILLVVLVAGILIYGAIFLIAMLAGVPLTAGRAGAAMAMAGNPVMLLGSLVIGTLGSLVMDALMVSIHAELDDGSGGHLADVFA